MVEDEDELRTLLVDDLVARGYPVIGLPSAEALYRYMSVEDVDIVVLDIGLPGESGLTVASHLRQLATVGIIMLTARPGRRTMVQALAEGADLFLSKPVDYDVLAAAITHLHRQLQPATAMPAQAVSAWSLADGGWTLVGPDDQRVPLSESERRVLGLLFARPGAPVARTALIEALTDQPWDFDPHRLDVLIHRLRSRVSRVFARPLPLRAVRGTGYLLTP